MKYKTLIFDLDDTLIDNNESIKYAFKITLDELGISYSEDLFEKWKQADKEYWNKRENATIQVPEEITSLEDRITYVRAKRFMQFFNNLNFEDAVYINKIYCDMLGVNIFEIPNASKLLSELKENYEILIATNGPKEAANLKLKKASLDDYISYLITPEEVGIGKPSQEFFDYICEKSQNKDRSKMLMIGDSLSTDILCGMINNVDTCWFNPENEPIPDEYNPTMMVNKLLQLKKKL